MKDQTSRPVRHLSAAERACIEVRLEQNHSMRKIARSLGRAASTISRELTRNRPLAGSPQPGANPPAGGCARRAEQSYCCLRAQERARCLLVKQRRPPRLVPGNALWNQVVGYLRDELSPWQCSDTILRVHQARISHEAIYQALYAMPKGELRREILALLPWGRKGRKARGGGVDRRGLIPGMTSIDERPIEVDERLVPGHWEGDLIKGALNRSQIGTLVERTTLYVLLVKVPKATAVDTANAFIGILNRVDAQCRLSMTYDQGKEMSHHEHLARQTGMKVYFAHPHSPWERGINENTNGLLRRYFPKGTDLSEYTQEQLDEVAFKLNAKPRKSLGGKCPAELFLPNGTFDFIAYWSRKTSPSTAASVAVAA